MRAGWFSEFLRSAFWEKSFLPEFWNDFGVLATLLGLVVAICQLRKTKNAANAAEEAAQKALEESRKSSQHYNGFIVQQQLEVIKIHISQNDWKMSSAELNHFARHASAIAYSTSTPSLQWLGIAAKAREWSETLASKGEDKEMVGPQLGKWRLFLKDTAEKIDHLVAQIHPYQEEE